MKQLLAVMALALLAPTGALAAGLPYDFIKAEYIKSVPDDVDVEADGLGLALSVGLNRKVFLLASYAQVETDEDDFGGSFEISRLAAGLGVRGAVGRNADIVATAAAVRAELEGQGVFSGAQDDESGIELTLGVRSLIGRHSEFGIGLDHLDVGDSDVTYVTLDAVLGLTAALGLAGRMEVSDDEKVYRAGVRLAF